jgi:hypothetical protein
MTANIAEAGSEPKSQIPKSQIPKSQVRVSHARQVVDRVTLLRERVKRQERAIEAVIVERDKALECCEKQKALIAELQARIDRRSPDSLAPPLIVDDEIDLADMDLLSGKPTGSRGANFSHSVEAKPANRVNSMRSALLRIGGIELAESDESLHGVSNTVEGDDFDASEFQPIAEEQESAMRQVVAGVYSRLTSITDSRRELAGIESDGLPTSR